MKPRLAQLGLPLKEGRLPLVDVRHSTNQTPVVPAARTRYLAEISETVRGYKERVREQAQLAREIQQLKEAARMLKLEKRLDQQAEVGNASDEEIVTATAAVRVFDIDVDLAVALNPVCDLLKIKVAEKFEI